MAKKSTNQTDAAIEIDETELPDSKSAAKRQMHELQNLGEALLNLNNQQRDNFPLSAELIEALDEAKRIKKHEALRRHKQFIGKVMRQEPEIETIKQMLQSIESARDLNGQQFKQLELLREQLITGGKTELGQVIEQFPTIDRQKLRQLTSKAQKEANNNQNNNASDHKASKALFRFLRENSELNPDNP